ncbi:hypothetical protein [Ruegeria marina]|uniref:Uncharacterized protein n=1 Tax=Ruegeria marina TaxID=639004 RepID=A0A1G6KUY9_9RHOB|nr:hypothetical protein [Ruegeria marina]SDC34763.1 hypothetical protein SAMN04488239_10259 [Ruegeria marina]
MGAEIVTCCYCGSRTGLAPGKPGVFNCGSCGAPVKRVEGRMIPATTAPIHAETRREKTKVEKSRPKNRKKKKSLAHRLFDKVSDAIDDIFD